MSSLHETTFRRRELGYRLRRAMRSAGMNGAAVARRLRWPESRMSRTLSGHYNVGVVDVAAFLAVCGITGEDRQQTLELGKDHGHPDVYRLHGPQRFTSYRDHAATATRVTEFQTHMLPWSLQTPAYTQAVLDALAVTSAVEAPAWVREDRDTTNLFTLRHLPRLDFFVHEWLLRAPVGDSAVMSEQLHHLLRQSVREPVSLRVVPLSAGALAGGGGPFTLMWFAQDRPLIYREEEDAGVFLDEPSEVNAYRAIVTRLRSIALDEDNSRALITELAANHAADNLVLWGGAS